MSQVRSTHADTDFDAGGRRSRRLDAETEPCALTNPCRHLQPQRMVGRNVTATQLRSASAAVPLGVRTLAVRLQSGAAPARAAIGDLTVLTLGDLSDLAIVLRKAAA